jgi:hypothetical protein
MKVLTIGRTTDNDIVFNLPQVSRHHAQLIRRDNGAVSISDMGSKNGTYINRQRIYGEVVLHVGDRVKIANVLLEWQRYFPAPVRPQPMPSNNWWVWGVAAAVVVTLLVVVGGLLFYSHNSSREIIFDGKYPPVKTIAYTENGKEYETEAFAGQLEMIFDENVSIKSARSQIKALGGRVIAQIPNMHYFLVEVRQGGEAYFLHRAKNSSGVSFVNLHVPLYPCHATIAVIDNFSYVNEEGHIHGNNVSEAARIGCDNCATWMYNAGSKTGGILYPDTITTHLEYILNKSDEPLVINMSFGVGLSDGKKWKEKATTQTERNSYVDQYKKSIIGLIDKLKDYHDKRKDFVITKSSGNEGCDVFDKEILNSLYESFKPWEKEIFDKHIILIGSIDDKVNIRRQDGNIYVEDISNDHTEWTNTYLRYGNRPVNYNPMYTAYNISHLSYKNYKSVDGTSFSSPEVAGQIARLINDYEITAVGALEILKQATKENAKRTGTPGILNALELDKKAREISYKYKQAVKTTDHVSVSEESYKPKSDTMETTLSSGTTAYSTQSADFTGHWATSDFDFQLSLKQTGNQISGVTHSNDRGGDNEMQYTLSGAVSGNTATVEYYSDYWGQNMKGRIQYLSNDKIEWTQIPQKGRDVPGKTILYIYAPVQSVISHEEQEKMYDEMEQAKSISSETFTIEASGNQNYQDFYLLDGSMIQCGLYSYGLGDLTLKVTSFAPYPVSVHWNLNATGISPLHGSGNLSAKGKAGNLRIWNDFNMTGDAPQFYSTTITVSKL